MYTFKKKQTVYVVVTCSENQGVSHEQKLGFKCFASLYRCHTEALVPWAQL